MWRQALCSVLSDSSLFIVTTLRGTCGCTPILQLRKLKREDSHVSGPRTQRLEVAEPEVRSRKSGLGRLAPEATEICGFDGTARPA